MTSGGSVVERFASFDGTEIAYEVQGERAGPPVLLLHGYAAEHRLNWIAPGIAGALLDAGRWLVLPDHRGHGASGKPHDPAAYGGDTMVRDVQLLLDELAVDEVDVVGYSLGALIGMHLAVADERTRSLVIGGVGSRLVDGTFNRAAVAGAMEANDGGAVEHADARMFRLFAEATGADLEALAAFQRAPGLTIAPAEEIDVPTLVLVGEDDTLAGSPHELAARIPGAIARSLHGDHLGAVLDAAFRESIVAFVAEAARR